MYSLLFTCLLFSTGNISRLNGLKVIVQKNLFVAQVFREFMANCIVTKCLCLCFNHKVILSEDKLTEVEWLFKLLIKYLSMTDKFQNLIYTNVLQEMVCDNNKCFATYVK